jgi:hypothetical protein
VASRLGTASAKAVIVAPRTEHAAQQLRPALPGLIVRLFMWFAANRRTVLIAISLALASESMAWITVAAYGHWGLGKQVGLGSLCSWDCGWYSSIIDRGYDTVPSGHANGDAANWAFFPLFPLLAGLVQGIAGLSTAHSLLLTSSVLLPVSIIAFIRLIEAYDIRLDPWLAGSLVAFNPYVVYAHVGYTEPLYLALSAGALVGLRRDRWLAAGILGSGAAATRLVGLFIVLPMMTRVLQRRLRSSPRSGRDEAPLAPFVAIGLVPLGLALFGLHLHYRMGDVLAFAHAQIGAWDHIPDNPIPVLWGALTVPGWYQLFALIAIAALLASLYLCVRGSIGLGLMLAATTLLPLFVGLGSMPRYVFWQPTFLLALAMLLQHRLARITLLPVLWGGSVVMHAAWITGNNFVV